MDIAATAISGLCLAFVALASWFLQQEVSLWYKRRELIQKEQFEQSLKKLEEERRSLAAAEKQKTNDNEARRGARSFRAGG